jgi:hypothetical protein
MGLELTLVHTCVLCPLVGAPSSAAPGMEALRVEGYFLTTLAVCLLGKIDQLREEEEGEQLLPLWGRRGA